PSKLFEANFQAWRYGPVEFDVYKNEKNGFYNEIQACDFNPDIGGFEKMNIKEFTDSIISQTDKIDDFGLVDRTHQDDSWFDVYEEGQSYIDMDNEMIILEYLERYVN